jgi:hypothetical protein
MLPITVGHVRPVARKIPPGPQNKSETRRYKTKQNMMICALYRKKSMEIKIKNSCAA